MAKKRYQKNMSQRNPQFLGMVLIGAGLLVFSIVAWVLLPKPGQTAASAQEPSNAGVPSAIPVAVEYPAPELSLTDLSGKAVTLADYKGQVVLVNNWAIWCPPCKAEMPILQSYYTDYQQLNFTIIGIEAGEPSSEVAAFVQDYQLSFPIWPDPQQQAMRAFQTTSLPTSFVIDRTGVVRLAWTGAISREVLEQYVTPLLEE